ncbi:DASS family sodium-coupled anion symporter [Candidatus Micrarchaeota archaeon]|nr:DASS family sodium-coupled anion symporter [Candidatus Micrarchaeota archaeon]
MDNRLKLAILLAAALAALAVHQLSGLPTEMGVVAAITVFVGILWFTETISLWITALAVPALLVTFAGIKPAEAFTPFFDPIIALLLGGFALGLAVQRQGLDARIASLLSSVFGTRPKRYLLGLMVATGFLSMWMANTAAAAVMMPVGVAALAATKLGKGSNYAKALVLGVGYSATIGGIGTLIGTPPNLIAAKWLGESGIMNVTFVDWMVRALPLVLVMIPLAWLVLISLYKPEVDKVKVRETRQKRLDNPQKATIGIFALTAFLWLTESAHGVHSSVVAMLPIISLFGLNIIGKEDISRIGWDMLILIGGGLSLGSALHSSGLDAALASGIAGVLAGQAPFFIFLMLSVFSIALTVFVANTAAAAILIPVMIPLTQMLGVNPAAVVFLIGMVVSFDFIVPVGTPPNAIAYGTGYVRVKEMAKAGLILAALGSLLVSALAFLW